MTKYILIICMLFASISGACADNLTSPPVSIVPRPVQVVPGEGNFTFSARTLFSVENHEQAVIVRNFINLFKRSSGITPQLAIGSSEKSHVRFTTDSSLKSEAYQFGKDRFRQRQHQTAILHIHREKGDRLSFRPRLCHLRKQQCYLSSRRRQSGEVQPHRILHLSRLRRRAHRQHEPHVSQCRYSCQERI